MIYLWPLAAAAILYFIFEFFDVHQELLTYISIFIGIFAITIIWWWHMVRHG